MADHLTPFDIARLRLRVRLAARGDWTRAGLGWEALRAIFFAPCLTALRGQPWEDLQ